MVPLESLFIWLNLLWGPFSGLSNWNVAICNGTHRPKLAVEGAWTVRVSSVQVTANICSCNNG